MSMDVWGEEIPDDSNYFAEFEDPDPDGERRGPFVSIWHTGGDGTEFDVYGETIENARDNARWLIQTLADFELVRSICEGDEA
jgi:hypothetical protein